MIGHSFSRDYLRSTLGKIWKLDASQKLQALGKGVYLLKNLPSPTLRFIMERKPWYIGGKLVAIKEWEPGLQVSNVSFSNFPVWLELPELPVEFHTPGFLKMIGNQIGHFLKFDASGYNRGNLRSARIQVDFDLRNRLPSFIWLGEVKQPLQFEEVPMWCTGCQTGGHHLIECRKTKHSAEVEAVRSFQDPPSQEQQNKKAEWTIVQRKKKKGGVFPSKAKTNAQAHVTVGNSNSNSSSILPQPLPASGTTQP